MIKEAGAALERLWRSISEGEPVAADVIVTMEAIAGRLMATLDESGDAEMAELLEKLDPSRPPETSEVIAFQPPDQASLGGLLTSVSETLLGGATRVDTGHLYRLINRIVEVALDADALADLSLVSIEGADPELFRKSWRRQLERLSESIDDIQDQAVALANVPFFDAVSTFPQFVRYLARRMGKDVRIEVEGQDIQLDRQIVDLIREPLRHLLVNAVDHGIEGPDMRVAAGKPATGTIRVHAATVDQRVEVSVSDDGAGIDWDRVAEVAHDRGLPILPPDLLTGSLPPGVQHCRWRSTDFSGTARVTVGARPSDREWSRARQFDQGQGAPP